MMLISILVMAVLCGIILARLFFIAHTPAGALFYYPNIIYDFLDKRCKVKRRAIDAGIFCVALTIVLLSSGLIQMVVALLLLLGLILEIYLQQQEKEILASVYAHQDKRWMPPINLQQNLPRGALPAPCHHPELVINLVGPFISRVPVYDLGDIKIDRSVEIEIIVANHSILPCQIPFDISMASTTALEAELTSAMQTEALQPGQIYRGVIRLQGKKVDKEGRISISIMHADMQTDLTIVYHSIFDGQDIGIQTAQITRYPGACQSAFAWRGDMDLYDTSTFQSIDGLTHTLGLAARYRFPQTMYLSARLSVNRDEAAAFQTHFQVQRGHDQVPAFINWFQKNVSLFHSFSYPFEIETPYAMELGNHMYLHYGTDAAAAKENNWKLWAKMGDGDYIWQGEDRSSFAEQRDNALAAKSAFKKYFGFSPKSWAMPDSTNDQFTPIAVEAAGCSVLSDSDARQKDNVLFQPPPHHPKDCDAVELTKRYPGDPQDVTHLYMFYYWLHRGYRLKIPVIFMCHQHLRLYNGWACTHFTEHVMRYVLTQFNGDFHINTVFGIGAYWRAVFSPKCPSIYLEVEDGGVGARNTGEQGFEKVPVDVVYENGRRTCFLVNLPARGVVTIKRDGTIENDVLPESSKG